MKIIKCINHSMIVAFYLMFAAGCVSFSPPFVSHSPVEQQYIYSDTDYNCLERYRIALAECDSFLNGQVNPLIKDRQMIKCLANKGFLAGADSCR